MKFCGTLSESDAKKFFQDFINTDMWCRTNIQTSTVDRGDVIEIILKPLRNNRLHLYTSFVSGELHEKGWDRKFLEVNQKTERSAVDPNLTFTFSNVEKYLTDHEVFVDGRTNSILVRAQRFTVNGVIKGKSLEDIMRDRHLTGGFIEALATDPLHIKLARLTPEIKP